MDQPSYEQISLIDQRLASLYEEVQLMENQYGFSKEFTQSKTIQQQKTTKQNNPKSLTRYAKLPQVTQTPSVEKIQPSPQISSTWKEIFTEKPQLQTFYDEKRFYPVFDQKNELSNNQFENEVSQDNFSRFFTIYSTTF